MQDRRDGPWDRLQSLNQDDDVDTRTPSGYGSRRNELCVRPAADIRLRTNNGNMEGGKERMSRW